MQPLCNRRGTVGLRDFVTYAVYRSLGGLVGRFPPRFGYWFASQVGWLLYLASPRLKCALADNIRHAVGLDGDEPEVQSLVRRACVNIAKGHYDLFRVGRMTPDEIEATVQVEGWEHLGRALAEGGGAIFFSAHFGNVDLVMQVTCARGVPTTAPVEHTRPERLFQYARSLRESHGMKLIPADGPMMGLYRALKRGELVGLAADRDSTNSGRVIKFFGVPARLPDGAVRVALRTGAPLMPVFAARLPDNSFLVQIEAPLELRRTGDGDADVEAGMKLVVAAMERHIGKHPEQWLVAQPIWLAQ